MICIEQFGIIKDDCQSHVEAAPYLGLSFALNLDSVREKVHSICAHHVLLVAKARTN